MQRGVPTETESASLAAPYYEDSHPENNWEQLKKCIMESAEECIGRAKRKQPDWFLDSFATLMPLVTAKRKAHTRFLQNPTTAAKKEFRKHQRAVKKAVDEAKEEWIGKVTREAELARRDWKQRWKTSDSCRWLLWIEDQPDQQGCIRGMGR